MSTRAHDLKRRVATAPSTASPPADYLLSRDSDLLDLMKWEREEGRAFQQRFRFLKIVTPVEFLQVMERRPETS